MCPIETLFVAAWSPEFTGLSLPSTGTASTASTPNSTNTAQSTKHKSTKYKGIKSKATRKTKFDQLALGIGPIESSLALERHLAREAMHARLPKEIILLGSTGLLDAGTGISEFSPAHSPEVRVLAARSFSCLDLPVLIGQARLPSQQKEPIILQTKAGAWAHIFADFFFDSCRIKLLPAHINTVSYISLKEYGQDLQKFLQPHLKMPVASSQTPSPDISFDTWGPLAFGENMEAGSLARVAHHYGVSFSAWLVVTNQIHAHASESWQRQYQKMAHALNTQLSACIDKIERRQDKPPAKQAEKVEKV